MSALSQCIGLEAYTNTLLREFIPNEVFATRRDEESQWRYDEQRSLLHDHWQLRPETSGDLLLRDTAIARFDLPVGEFGVRLNDPSLRHYCLTAKLSQT
jgi:hypothetical protein